MADYGFKISKPGFDVGTAGVTDLVFSSSLDTLKTKLTGVVTGTADVSISHGLSYTPIFFACYAGYFMPYATYSVTVDGTNMNIPGPGTDSIRYYIFYKQS